VKGLFVGHTRRFVSAKSNAANIVFTSYVFKMSESRRVQLISSIPAVTEKKKTEKPALTVRLVLSIEEATDVSCPEFSYVELVKNATVSDENGAYL